MVQPNMGMGNPGMGMQQPMVQPNMGMGNPGMGMQQPMMQPNMAGPGMVKKPQGF